MAPRKPNHPTLTREQIVSAAIQLVDRDGLDHLSMRRLASELGMSPMSLYYHVPDKSALYDLILEAVMAEMDLSADNPSAPAEDRAVTAACALRDALLAHPNAIPIALSRSLRTEGQLRPIEQILGILFDAGLSPTDALAAVDIVGQYVLGVAAGYANHAAGSEYHDALRTEDLTSLDPAEFPNMTRVTREGEYLGLDGEFDRGVRLLVRALLTADN